MGRISTPERENYPAWRSTMIDLIRNHPEDSALFWLLDSPAHPSLPGILWNLEPMPDALPLYMSSYYDEVVNSGPFLVQCKVDSPIMKWILQEAENRPLASLIHVDKSASDDLFDHLQNVLECMYDGELTLFRFYDPRVLYGIQTSKDNKSITKILGPICRWDSWEPGRCVAIQLGNGLDSGYRCEGPLKYPDDFLQHIWDENNIHTLVAQLSHRFKEFSVNTLQDSYKYIEDTYNFLSKYEFEDRESLTYGACIAAYHGKNIWNNTTVKEAFNKNCKIKTLVDICTELNIG